MSALHNKSEAERATELTNLFERLHQLSARQVAWVEQHYEDENFLEIFQNMSNEWSSLQSSIQDEIERCRGFMTEQELREAIVSTAPKAKQAHDNVERAIFLVKQIMHQTGTTLRTSQERKQAAKAYQTSGYEDYAAIFFDEKK